jgi:tetratricopeptide (TPR) repeat protein
MEIDIQKHIQTLLREIDIYRSHGLLVQAKQKCQEMAEVILQSNQVENKQKLMTAVSREIRCLENDARKREEAEASAQMSTKEQDLIKELFPSSEEEGADSAALKVAAALLVFGQFEKALKKFNELIKKDSLRLVAAKNVLRCHIGRSSLDSAVGQYEQWLSSGQFTSGELEKIRSFLQDILKKRGMDKRLPKPKGITDSKEDEIPEGEFIDISSIVIPLDNEAEEEKSNRLDVSFQRGNIISVTIPSTNQVLIDNLKVGLRLNHVRFYSPSVMFKDSCVVCAISQIKSGPKKADCILEMKILNT